METSSERRRRKLELLCRQNGGHTSVGERSKVSAAMLDQVIKGVLLPPKKGDGSRSERGLGDSAARAIEGAFGLERGWFDNDSEDVEMTAKELQLLGYFRELDLTLQELIVEKVRETADQRLRIAEQLGEALKPAASQRKGKERAP